MQEDCAIRHGLRAHRTLSKQVERGEVRRGISTTRTLEASLRLPLPRSRGDLVQTVLLALVYAVLGVITLALPETSIEIRRMIWAPSGIALAWLMLRGIGIWPGIFLGAGLATALAGGAPLHAAGTAIANTAEVVFAVLLFRQFGLERQLESRRHLLVFLGVLVATAALAAILSVGSLVASGGLPPERATTVWFMWWLTHVMGQIVFAPLILAMPPIGPRPPRLPMWESITLSLGLGLSLSLSFTAWSPHLLRDAPLTFLSFPFLFWAAFRCGQFGASTASFVAAAFAVTGTLLGIGPFVNPDHNTSLFQTLVFVAAAEFSALFVAGLVAERRRAELDRERIERVLARSEKLESLGALAGGIAHDFNNLLVAILGNVDLVLMDTDPSSSQYDALEQSVRASERAAELCRQLLAYAGQGPFEHAVVSLTPLVREMTTLAKLAIPKGTPVEYELAPGLLPIRADTSQIRRVVLNLFTNAGEAIGPGPGRIIVRTRDVPDSAALDPAAPWFLPVPEGPLAVLEIEDTGEGIEADHIERVFEPVFTTRGAGRGLGLASVLGIVRSHGGAIQVWSRRGEGTRFTLVFPRVDAPIDDVPVPPIPRVRPDSGLVLVVADLREARRRGLRLPVLLSSGYVLEPIEVLAELGPAHFLPKPYTLAALESALARLLRSPRS